MMWTSENLHTHTHVCHIFLFLAVITYCRRYIKQLSCISSFLEKKKAKPKTTIHKFSFVIKRIREHCISTVDICLVCICGPQQNGFYTNQKI